MEVYQPLDFSNGVPMSAILGPHSAHGAHSPPMMEAKQSVLDLCVRRPSPDRSPHSPARSPASSPPSPRSPLYHPYLLNNNNNNNNSKSVNQNDLMSHQLLLRAKMEADAAGRCSLPSPPGFPHAELPDGGHHVPALSVLQQRLLPRSATSAFAPAQPSALPPALPPTAPHTAHGVGLPSVPAVRRRRTSSGLPDSPLGSSDDRSSTAASPSPSPPSSLDLLNPLMPLPGLGHPHPHHPGGAAVSPTGALPTQSAHGATPARNGKPTRPFKAYPKDPLSLAAGVQVNSGTLGAAEAALGRASNEAYAEFRRRMLAQVQAAIPSKAKKLERKDERAASPTRQQAADSPTPPYSEGTLSSLSGLSGTAADSSNTLSPEASTTSMTSPSTPTECRDGKDAAYWERRRKNNEAAKRSRDARRAKEDEIAIRAAFLEQENLKLKYEVAALRNETAKLRCLLYSGAAEC